MKKIFNNYFFNILLIISIGCIVIYFSVNAYDIELLDLLQTVDIRYLFIVIAIVLGYQSITGIVLTVLTRFTHPDYKISSGIINSLVASLFHGITPSSTGGQIAQFYVYRKQGVGSGDAGSILWMEFIIYQSCLTLVSLLFIILKFPYFYSQFSNLFVFVILGFIINTSIIFILYGLAKFKSLHDWIADKGIDIAYKFHLVKDKEATLNNVEMQLSRFRLEVENLKLHKKTIILCAFLCVLRLLMYYSVPYFVFLALGGKLDIVLLINAIAMGSFVAIASGMIPIPGASGGTEVIFIMMFSNLFGKTLSASSMILWRFATFYFVLMLGTIDFGYIKFKR